MQTRDRLDYTILATSSIRYNTCSNCCDSKTQWSKIKAIGKGTQSLLRAELIRSGEKYIERGWIEVYAKDAYDKCYQSYHHLGQNGTMNDMHEKVMDLPTNPIIRKDENNE